MVGRAFWKVFSHHRRLIFWTALGGFVAVAAIASARTPRYEAQVTVRNATVVEKRLRSRQLLEPVIRDLGLQAELRKPRRPRTLLNMGHNLRTELSRSTDTQEREIRFTALSYDGPEPLSLLIHFTSPTHFDIHSIQGELLEHGEVGKPVMGDGYTFSLSCPPDDYRLTLHPLDLVLDRLHSCLKMERSADDPALLNVTCIHPNCELAQQIINRLQAEYLCHPPKAPDPIPPRLFLFGLLGASLSTFATLSGLSLRAAFTGLPEAPTPIDLSSYCVAGTLSPTYEPGDPLNPNDLTSLLNSLRHPARTFAILTNGGPLFAPDLATLLPHRTLLIDCSFSSDEAGLLQVLDGSLDTLPIIAGDYDYLPSGGPTRNPLKLLASEPFGRLLANLDYEAILLHSPAPACSAGARYLSELADATILAVEQKKLQETCEGYSPREALSLILL